MVTLLPDAAPQGLADATTSNPTSPNTFGAGVAGEVQDQGQKIIDMVNSNLASDMLTTGVQRLAKRWGEFSQLEGQNAFNAVDGYQKDVKQIMTGVVNASPNLKVRSLVAQSLAYQADRYMLYGQDHANGALKQWNIKSAQDGAANNYSQMGIALQNGDRDGALANMHAGDDQLLHLNSTIHGLPTDAATMETAKARDSYITNTLRDISNSNPPRAVALFDDPEIGGKLTANARAVLLPQIRDAKADIVVDASQQDMTGPDAFVDGIPNKQAWMDAALKRGKELDPGDPDLLHRIQQKVTQRYQTYAADYAGNKQAFTKNLDDTRTALQNGVDAPIDEKAIRFYYPGEAGDRVVQELNIAKVGGQVASDLRFASPQEVNDDLTQLTTGMGRKADDLWIQYKYATGPGTAPGSTPAPADADFYRLRATAVNAAKAALDARSKALHDDPGAYAATEPGVKVAAQAFQDDLSAGRDPHQTGSMDKYFSTISGLYEHMGVAPEDQHFLARTYAEGLSDGIVKAGDPVATISQYAQQFGDHWPKIFNDLVTVGKLPVAYQGLVSTPDRPGLQVGDASLLSRTLVRLRGMKPTEIDNLVPKRQEIENAVDADPNVREYLTSATNSGATVQSRSAIRSAIVTYAYGYAMEHGSAEPVTSAGAASHAFTHDLSKFQNTYVMTKDLPTVNTNAAAVIAGIRADTIQVPLGPYNKRSYAAAVASAPEWVATAKGDALQLRYGNQNVMWHDGSPVTVPFNKVVDHPVPNFKAAGAENAGPMAYGPWQTTQPSGADVSYTSYQKYLKTAPPVVRTHSPTQDVAPPPAKKQEPAAAPPPTKKEEPTERTNRLMPPLFPWDKR